MKTRIPLTPINWLGGVKYLELRLLPLPGPSGYTTVRQTPHSPTLCSSLSQPPASPQGHMHTGSPSVSQSPERILSGSQSL